MRLLKGIPMRLRELWKSKLETPSKLSRLAIIALALTVNCKGSAKQWIEVRNDKPAHSDRVAALSASLDPIAARILQIHNEARFAVGAPPLKWAPELAAHAAAYTQVLARAGQLFHSPREGRGLERENLTEAFHGSSPDQLMRYWLIEKRNFGGGIFPNVCKHDWDQCAHYSQMIWPTTTYVGCGLVPGVQWDFFVCRYSPGGNKDGKPVG